MANYSTNQFKNGVKVLVDGDPCSMIDVEFVKPGKGQAFVRVKLRNLRSGRVWERTYKSGESIEAADVMDVEMTYMYSDGESWHFMNNSSYEQLAANAAIVGEAAKWLKEDMACQVVLWNDNPISVEVPNFVELTVARCEPGVRGDTVSGATKPATLESGAEIKVPLFINQGDVLKVDTRTGDYVGRA